MHHFSLCRHLLLLVVALVAVVGCGNSGETADGKTVVQFWHFWSEPAQKKVLLEQIAAFEKQNPDVKVELSELSWSDGKTKLLAAFNSEQAPDVLELGSDWVAQFSAAGVLAEHDAAGAGRFPKEFVAPGLWQGKVYALPWVVDTRVLFYNKELLAKAGADTSAAVIDSTWESVAAHAEKITASVPGSYGFGANGPDQHRLYKKIIPFFWSNGGQVLTPEGAPAINSPENVAALEAYVDLAHVGLVETQKQLDQLFVSGKVGYWISGSWLVDRIKKDNPSLRYDVAILPKLPNGSGVSFAGGEYLAINEASEQKEAAKKLVAFLTSPEGSLSFSKALPGGMTPADPSVLGDPFFQTPVRKVFAEQLRNARMTPVHPKWLDIESVIEEEVSYALLGKKEAKAALDAAQSRIDAIVKKGAQAGGR